MEKKYEFTGETLDWGGRILNRIRAVRGFGLVKKGELGGWIEKEENLSHDGKCWVFHESKVCDNGRVCDNSKVYDNAVVWDNTLVCNNARVSGVAVICDYTVVCGNSIVCGDAIVRDNARVSGEAVVSGNAVVRGNARISSKDDIFLVGPIGSRNDYTTFYKGSDGKIMVVCGCFHGNIEKFEKAVEKTHNGNKYEKEYKAVIEVARLCINLKGE